MNGDSLTVHSTHNERSTKQVQPCPRHDPVIAVTRRRRPVENSQKAATSHVLPGALKLSTWTCSWDQWAQGQRGSACPTGSSQVLSFFSSYTNCRMMSSLAVFWEYWTISSPRNATRRGKVCILELISGACGWKECFSKLFGVGRLGSLFPRGMLEWQQIVYNLPSKKDEST